MPCPHRLALCSIMHFLQQKESVLPSQVGVASPVPFVSAHLMLEHIGGRRIVASPCFTATFVRQSCDCLFNICFNICQKQRGALDLKHAKCPRTTIPTAVAIAVLTVAPTAVATGVGTAVATAIQTAFGMAVPEWPFRVGAAVWKCYVTSGGVQGGSRIVTKIEKHQ